jgi:hypothetical protein
MISPAQLLTQITKLVTWVSTISLHRSLRVFWTHRSIKLCTTIWTIVMWASKGLPSVGRWTHWTHLIKLGKKNTPNSNCKKLIMWDKTRIIRATCMFRIFEAPGVAQSMTACFTLEREESLATPMTFPISLAPSQTLSGVGLIPSDKWIH